MLFWSDSIPENLTRIEYARNLSKTSLDAPIYLEFMYNPLIHSIYQFLFDLVFVTGIPVAMIAFIFVCIIPTLHHIALGVNSDFKFERLLLVDRKRKDYLDKKKIILDQTISSARDIESKQNQVDTKISKIQEKEMAYSIKEPEISKWENEYKNNPKIQNVLKTISTASYEKNGLIKPLVNGHYVQLVTSEELRLADSFNLIEFSDDRTRITLTQKAKHLNRFI